jgi:hypothetical protein
VDPHQLKEIDRETERVLQELQTNGKSVSKSTRVEESLQGILGTKYRASMKPTPLIQRLSRMKSELEHGEERFERKLRYLFWLN